MKLKICGVKTPEEAKALKEAGVEYIGLNFVPSSTRCISLEQAKEVMAALKHSGIHVVALFQDQPIELVSEYVRELDVDYVQLHGDESPEYARSVPKPVIKAIAVKPSATPDAIIKLLNNYPADYFVLDRAQQGKGKPRTHETRRQNSRSVPKQDLPGRRPDLRKPAQNPTAGPAVWHRYLLWRPHRRPNRYSHSYADYSANLK